LVGSGILGFGGDDFEALGESAVELDFFFHGELPGGVHGVKFSSQEEGVELFEGAELGGDLAQHLR
jgi:hypothetical protein